MKIGSVWIVGILAGYAPVVCQRSEKLVLLLPQVFEIDISQFGKIRNRYLVEELTQSHQNYPVSGSLMQVDLAPQTCPYVLRRQQIRGTTCSERDIGRNAAIVVMRGVGIEQACCSPDHILSASDFQCR